MVYFIFSGQVMALHGIPQYRCCSSRQNWLF